VLPSLKLRQAKVQATKGLDATHNTTPSHRGTDSRGNHYKPRKGVAISPSSSLWLKL